MKNFHIFAFFTSLVFIFAFIFLYRLKEPYENDLSFEENLFKAFKNNELTNYIKYMNFLTQNKNNSYKLISKEIFNKFKNKKDLSVDDIKQEL